MDCPIAVHICGMGRDSGIGSVGGTVGRPKDYPTIHRTVG